MLAALGKLMSLRKENDNENFSVDQEGRMACAALMTRAAWLDGTLDKVEENALRDLMMKRFEISPGEADEILKAAADDLDTSNDLYRYTKDLRDNFDADERLKLIEMIWEVGLIIALDRKALFGGCRPPNRQRVSSIVEKCRSSAR